MDFADDLLGDILSDESSDSFFDDPKKATKKSTKKAPEKTIESKQDPKSDDWLGSGTSSRDGGSAKPDLKAREDWLGLTKTDDQQVKERDVLKSPSNIKKPIKKISFEDDDILGTLGLNKKPEKAPLEGIPKDDGLPDTKGKKSEFLESILKTSKKEDTLDDILKSTRVKSAADNKMISTTSQSKADIQDSSIIPMGGRRKRVTSGLVDPLGLFSNETKDEPAVKMNTDEVKHLKAYSYSSGDIKDIDNLSSTKSNFGDGTRSAPNLFESSGLPDWLAGSSKSKSSEADWGAVSFTKSKSEITLSDKTENIGLTERPTVNVELPTANMDPNIKDTSNVQPHFLNSFLAHQKMAQSQMEYQNTTISLQQQESQILMALQMKKYEDNLMEIQRQQQEILTKQEQQFNALLERQFSKQHAMENNMRLQQERINSHIQLLLAQPKIDTPAQQIKEETERVRESAAEEHVKAYENIINNLKQRQHEELFILEESYKKQISILEDTTNNTETRLKAELEAALSRSEENIKFIRESHEKDLEKFKMKIEEIEENHAKEMKFIRDNHMRVIEEIKYEHNLIIDNIKESKRNESAMFKEAGDFGQKLDANIQLLFNNSQILQNVSGKIETETGVLSTAKQEMMRAKEKEIDMMRSALDKSRESAETEKIQLLTLVRSLEMKMAEQSHGAQEERWSLQQAISMLAARSAAFDREAEFSKASIEREREQLKTLKEALLAEQEKVILQLTEEKLTISAEKSRLQTSNKLNFQFDTQKVKAELEAAMQVAKEAAEMTDRERENLQRKICEIESLKRTLQDKERKLASKEIDLSRLAHISEQKSQEGEKALQEASVIEMRCNERMKQLQGQLLQLSTREKKITEDKIALSKERIALNTLMRQQRMCSLCTSEGPHIDERKGDWNNDFNKEEVAQFPRFDVTEAEIFRLQFEDKEDNTNTAYNNL